MTKKNPQKKEGAAASAASPVNSNKTEPQVNLSTPLTLHVSTEGREKKNPAELDSGITEAGAAEKLRISEEEVSWLRKGILDAGKDFIRGNGCITITAAGIEKMAAEIAKGSTLLCIASRLPNPKLVLARRPGSADIIRVRVADSESWCKGMTMPECVISINPQIAMCEARPRFKGRI